MARAAPEREKVVKLPTNHQKRTKTRLGINFPSLLLYYTDFHSLSRLKMSIFPLYAFSFLLLSLQRTWLAGTLLCSGKSTIHSCLFPFNCWKNYVLAASTVLTPTSCYLERRPTATLLRLVTLTNHSHFLFLISSHLAHPRTRPATKDILPS